jgi:hypothetical protein
VSRCETHLTASVMRRALAVFVWRGPAERFGVEPGESWVCLTALGDDLIWVLPPRTR